MVLDTENKTVTSHVKDQKQIRTKPNSLEGIFLIPPNGDELDNSIYDRNLMLVEDRSPESYDSMKKTPFQQVLWRFLPLTLFLSAAFEAFAARIQLRIMNEYLITNPHQTSIKILKWTILNVLLIAVVKAFAQLFLLDQNLRYEWPSQSRINGDEVPTVDIFITMYNEDIDVQLDTIRAALNVDYPKKRFRVVVTDDGNSQELGSNIKALQNVHSNLFYTARNKSGPDGYKAGNINHALQFTSTLAKGGAELVAGLDADMIPEPNWLRSLVSHLVQDLSLGLVCPPQQFYNLPPNDPLCQSQTFAFRCTELQRDAAGTAWCTGSGFVMRRQAVTDIGGIPRVSLTEDVACSVLMLIHGWKTRFIPEALQYGLMPETYFGHVKQYTRWSVGGAQIAAAMRFYLFNNSLGSLGIQQRLRLLGDQLQPYLALPRYVAMLITPWMLYSSYRFNVHTDVNELRLFLRLECISAILTWMTLLYKSSFSSFQYQIGEDWTRIWMSPYYSIALVRTFLLPQCLGGKVTTFTATGSLQDTLQERYRRLRSPLHMRLKYILLDCQAGFHLMFVLVCLVGAGARTLGIYNHLHNNPRAMWIELLANPFSPTLTWVGQVGACLVPVLYACFPPDMPDREDTLVRDPKTGVAYPSEKVKQPKWTLLGFGSIVKVGMLSFMLAVLISTWWL